MGKLGRFACILTPMLCTLASLVCIVLLLIAGTSNNVLPSVYYMQLDLRHINLQSSIDVIPGGTFSHNVSTGITSGNAQDLGLKNFYTTYLWNYCSSASAGGNDQCEKSKSGYTFDVENIIQSESKKNVTFPDSVQKVQKAVNVVSKFMAACYVLAGVATVVTFIVGWFGLLSRWGSCVTTIFADIAFGFLLTASVCATALAYSLKGAFNKAFDSFGVDSTIGQHWMRTTWMATIFAAAAGVFWMMSMCCCSGRTRRVMGHDGPAGGKNKGGMGMRVERTGYERVGASPLMAQHEVPMHPYGAPPAHKPGFEPLRHGKV
ncbi:SUR7/PalI family-domain-containing protein [Sphaerosporella brunnea]|uniref:SUR7/PalI family-domain-containing protein n=1 Tax=Sphaerosporella brunnea TaxID=1250544 RepID=A0A5J5F9I0_9PEZI|nr:SUR7/PalI family-domain-containing protein [Sphaerosporella brunnea]